MIEEISGVRPMLVYIPDNYDQDKPNYTWLFEPGNSEISGVENLYKYSLLGFIRNGYKPDFIFAAVSPGTSWATPAAAVNYLRERFPKNKLIGTGLSMGAWVWANYVLTSVSNAALVDGLVLMSTPLVDLAGAKNMKTKPILGFVGNGDSLTYWNHTAMMDTFKESGALALDVVGAYGHGGWADKYNPTLKPVAGLSIYAWMQDALPLDVVVTPPPTEQLKITDGRIDSIKVENGFIMIDVRPNVDHNLSVMLDIPVSKIVDLFNSIIAATDQNS